MNYVVASVSGKDYRPNCGQCNVPPWESCACSFPHGDQEKPK